MAALAGRCNLETREEMEAEHHREAAEKAQAELLCQHADQQVKRMITYLALIFQKTITYLLERGKNVALFYNNRILPCLGN